MTAEEIWTGDLFGRQAESDQLIGFLETVALRPSLREDGHAYVLAVDAPYGEGKSYFLRRFAKHMALTHPVAFVDAWTDDLEDEPLVALAATLEQAFSKYEDKSGELKKRMMSVINKTGRVAKIAAGGLFKRGIGLLITPGATEAAGAVVDEVSDATGEAIGEAVKDTIDDVSGEIAKVVTPSMQKRIERFNEGREAVEAMKRSLRDLVAYLGQDGVYPPPVVIVIDELDRCRPTYAIKLLEEIKHLFDVEGIVFVLGMHGNALGHSVSAAYGARFDGAAYLRRFITKRYTLQEPPLQALLHSLFKKRGINESKLSGGRFVIDGDTRSDPVALLALLMKSYGLNARDAFPIVDSIEICVALADQSLIAPLLLPLLFNNVHGRAGLPVLEGNQGWSYVTGRARGAHEEWEPQRMANSLYEASRLSDQALSDAINADDSDWIHRVVGSATFHSGGDALGVPRNYPKLLNAVRRFSDPNPMSA